MKRKKCFGQKIIKYLTIMNYKVLFSTCSLLAVLLFSNNGYSQADLNADKQATSECVTDCDLVGQFERKQLESRAIFNAWFSENYKNYDIDSATLDALKAIPKKNITFKVIMGTWCSDSRRDVPRFAKIMDTLKIDAHAIEYFALDSSKLSPEKIEDTYTISHVPTFIVFKDGAELNRIVEMSVLTLEEDLLNILTVNTYKNVYSE